jgi:hypothetical protein
MVDRVDVDGAGEGSRPIFVDRSVKDKNEDWVASGQLLPVAVAMKLQCSSGNHTGATAE